MSVKLRTPYVLTLLDAGSAPTAESNIIKLFARDPGTGNVELFVQDEAGNTSQLTTAGRIIAGTLQNSSGTVTLSGSAPSAGYALVATSATTATWQAMSNLQLTSNNPVAVDGGTALLGFETAAARGDHKHTVTTGTPSALTVGGANVAGILNSLARADHAHGLPAFGMTVGTFTEGNDSRLSDDRTASGLRTSTTVVSVSTAAAPSTGQVLTATSAAAATWQTPAAASAATALATSGASVVVNTASPPTTGQVLTALTATSANWQTPSGGGGGGGSYPYYGFDLVRGNTDQTSPDEIANTLFDPSGLSGVVRFVAVLECAIAGQTASLELYNITDGATVDTVSTTNTTSTKVSTSTLTLPSAEKLYGVRLSRTGGTAGDRVTCRLARFENTAS